MLTICAYLGTIKGEKLNEPESNLSPICKNKQRPEPGPNGLSVSGPSGSNRLAGLYLIYHQYTQKHVSLHQQGLPYSLQAGLPYSLQAGFGELRTVAILSPQMAAELR